MSADWLKNCVSVDIEAAGPHPAQYAMLSIGACLVTDVQQTFYVELKPDREGVQEHALSVCGFSLDQLRRDGIPPERAMRSFADWLSGNVPDEPLLVAFNAPFDWIFVNDYFHRYTDGNPFGHSAIDIKALYLGFAGGEWKATSMNQINAVLGIAGELSHHALEDAQDQAALFLQIIERIENKMSKEKSMSEQNPSAGVDLDRIVESAKRLGVELDEEEAIQWLTAISASKQAGDVVVDTRSGVFGHTVSMLDFSPEELEYFRKVGRIVEFQDEPGVETALALSGSAAQSKIQTYPGDADYFERINIKAESRAEACQRLAGLIRKKALDTLSGPTYQLIEVKFGSYPEDVVRDETHHSKGSPISWSADQVKAGTIPANDPQGSAITLNWDEVADDPGWCKLDWVVADPVRGQLANASNMLDVTWEAPDGSITPLDGYLDPYFQEVYLEAESIPLFSKLAKHVSADALEDYIHQLEKEVHKYITKQLNYGKAAKRMYNIFRLTGRYEEAAYVRELFDEPATALYQVYSLIRTIDDVIGDSGSITQEALVEQADKLVLTVVEALEGEVETEIVRTLLRLRSSLDKAERSEAWVHQVQAARAEIINLVNNFFHERLQAVPEIKSYIESMRSEQE